MDIFAMLEYDEGKRNSLYKDTEGYWTVGIGHLVTKNPSKTVAIAELDRIFRRSTGGTLTDREVSNLFNNDVKEKQADIARNKTVNEVYVTLDATRQMALLNMVFQMGVAGVAGFKSSLAMLKAKQWDKAAANLKLSKWNKQTPNRSNRVISVFQTGTTKAYK